MDNETKSVISVFSFFYLLFFFSETSFAEPISPPWFQTQNAPLTGINNHQIKMAENKAAPKAGVFYDDRHAALFNWDIYYQTFWW